MKTPATEERVAHTPGPWEVYGATEVCVMGEDWAHICVVSNPRKSSVEDSKFSRPEPVEIGNYRFHEACANAAFIVTACNAHEALVSALQTLVDESQAILEYVNKHGGCDLAIEALAQARAALSLATQKGAE